MYDDGAKRKQLLLLLLRFSIRFLPRLCSVGYDFMYALIVPDSFIAFIKLCSLANLVFAVFLFLLLLGCILSNTSAESWSTLLKIIPPVKAIPHASKAHMLIPNSFVISVRLSCLHLVVLGVY